MRVVVVTAVLAAALFSPTLSYSVRENQSSMNQFIALPLTATASNPASSQRRQSEFEVNLAHVRKGSFFTSITLGTPPQPFNIVVDTGSDRLWVPSVGCSSCPSSGHKYNAAASSSFTNATTSSTHAVMTYGSGTVNGTLATDTVVWGPSTIPNMFFYVVDSQDSTMAYHMSRFGDGIMGFVFAGGLDGPNHRDSVLYRMASQNQVPHSVFSLWLNQSSVYDANELDPYGGWIILGGADNHLYNGNFSFVPVSSASSYYWDITVTGISVAGSPVIAPSLATNAIVDSGTSIILIDSTTLTKLVQSLSGSQPSSFQFIPQYGVYTVQCQFAAALPDISFVVGKGVTLSFSASDYITYDADTLENSNVCELSIRASGGEWILGSPFLYKYYTVFDLKNKQIGFAHATDGKTVGNGTLLSDDILTKAKQANGAQSLSSIWLLTLTSLFFIF
ncbi:acid protease [Rhizoclosmatium globosum]|uniref:rhizopuspepsin n=1 Tax=Rhizoclosmatium globosum TaxID=329046 RepID=A0A1Y2CKY0_9FUNG|nr:acid protease [Rhizoclosmatium globosum]|eukprot:ORY47646.1 acid protease [Rhizoclosmatium globosum]